jgi:class 3 adenylate cyclase
MTSETSGVAGPASTAPPVLTFLIADVRGYTRFTAEHGEEAAARLTSRFADLAEHVVERHEGKVIELRGDEALCVFVSARNALCASVALQTAFRDAMEQDPSLPLQVGVGLDAGEAIPVKGGYRGGALNLAARLCSIAGAGEVFCSETVIGLARKTEGVTIVDRGEVTLKGLPGPVHVFQIAREGALPAELPPLQPILVTHPTNLPDEPTPFVQPLLLAQPTPALAGSLHGEATPAADPGRQVLARRASPRDAVTVPNPNYYDDEIAARSAAREPGSSRHRPDGATASTRGAC